MSYLNTEGDGRSKSKGKNASTKQKIGILGSMGEINDIQEEIEIYTKKIEHEKINLKLVKERYENQLKTYTDLQNNRKPKITWDNKGCAYSFQKKKVYIEGNDKKEFQFQRDIALHETELEKIADEVNHLILDNKELRREIEELRKEKKNCSAQLEILRSSKANLEFELRDLKVENEFNEVDKSGMISQKKIELDKVKKVGVEEQKSFNEERQVLEVRYHEILEDNIRREREEKKEQAKKRYKLSEVRVKKKNEVEMTAMEEEDISDRTPILNNLIEKWKYIIKTKKAMIERYRKNVYTVEVAFDKICSILGITDYTEIPFILEKIEDQNSSIKILINKLFNEVLLLENEKRSNEDQITVLRKNNSKNSMDKMNFTESTTGKIARLKKHIEILNQEIDKKREFFIRLQEPTDAFLESLATSYISDFVTGKVGINKAVKYNETNINDVIANVQDYQKLLEDGERALQNNEKRIDQGRDKEIEKMQLDNRNKLELIKKENLMSREISNSIKNEVKNNAGFDETIKRMAEEVMKMVNTQKKDDVKSKKK